MGVWDVNQGNWHHGATKDGICLQFDPQMESDIAYDVPEIMNEWMNEYNPPDQSKSTQDT